MAESKSTFWLNESFALPPLSSIHKYCKAALWDPYEKIAFHVIAAHEQGARLHHMKQSEMSMWKTRVPAYFTETKEQLARPCEFERLFAFQKDNSYLFYADEKDDVQQQRVQAALQKIGTDPERTKKLEEARKKIQMIIHENLDCVVADDLDNYPMFRSKFVEKCQRDRVPTVGGIPLQFMSEHGGWDKTRKFVEADVESTFRGIGLFLPVLYACDCAGVVHYVPALNFTTMGSCPVTDKGLPAIDTIPWYVSTRLHEKPYHLEQVIPLSMNKCFCRVVKISKIQKQLSHVS